MKIVNNIFSNLRFSWKYMCDFDLFASPAYYQPFSVAQQARKNTEYLEHIEGIS